MPASDYEPGAGTVWFDLDSLGSLRAVAGPQGLTPVTHPYPHLDRVIGDLADRGYGLCAVLSYGEVEEEVVVSLADSGPIAGLDTVAGWPEGTAPPPPPAGGGLLVSEDNALRGRALAAGWQVAPHPLLASALLAGGDARFVRVTAPVAMPDGEWRALLRNQPLVPIGLLGADERTVLAITVDAAIPGLAAIGFGTEPLGERGDPLTCDLYLIRDSAAPGSGPPDDDRVGRLLGTNDPTDQELVVAETTDGILVRLPFDRSIDELHAPLASHGHNLKLISDLGLLADREPRPALDPRRLVAERDLSTSERAMLAGITGAGIKSTLDRYTGVTPLGDASGALARSRHILHPDNDRSTNQLVADLQAIGGSRLVVSTHAFVHNGRTHHNVEAELTGTEPELVLVTAHLDSTAASSPPYNPPGDAAPGADDDGSGLAAVLAAAKVMVDLAERRQPQRTIRFVLFNAEEHGLVGSQAYARDALAAGADIEAVFQMDMIGYNVAAPRTCEIHAGYLASPATQAISALAAERVRRMANAVAPGLNDMQLYLSRTGDPDPAEGRSDHAPFQTRGWAACVATEDFFVGPAPAGPGEPNPNYHRRGDTLVDLDYAADIARAVAAAAWITAQPIAIEDPTGDRPMTIRIASGATTPGSTNWQPYGGNTGVFLDVDTTAGRFNTTPSYFTSIGGNSSHWATTGITSIYSSTRTGFRVYVRWSDGSALTPAQANSFQWHVNWVGVEP